MSVWRSNIRLFKFDESDAVLSIDFVQAASATTSTLEPPETNRHISNNLKPKFMTFTQQVAANFSFKITPNLYVQNMWLHGYSQFITEGFGKAQRLHSFWVLSSRRTAIV